MPLDLLRMFSYIYVFHIHEFKPLIMVTKNTITLFHRVMKTYGVTVLGKFDLYTSLNYIF